MNGVNGPLCFWGGTLCRQNKFVVQNVALQKYDAPESPVRNYLLARLEELIEYLRLILKRLKG